MNTQKGQEIKRWKREWEDLIREVKQTCLEQYIDSFVNASFTVTIFSGMLERDMEMVAADHRILSGHKYALIQLLRGFDEKKDVCTKKNTPKKQLVVKKRLAQSLEEAKETDNKEALNKFKYKDKNKKPLFVKKKLAPSQEEEKEIDDNRDLNEFEDNDKSKKSVKKEVEKDKQKPEDARKQRRSKKSRKNEEEIIIFTDKIGMTYKIGKKSLY